MKKLAIFVEGQTELLFICHVIEEIAGKNDIVINKCISTTNRDGNRSFKTIEAQREKPETKYYVLVYDCGGETNVKSDIKDHCKSLANGGYESIIGLRDVYPKTKADIPKIEFYNSYGMPTKYIPINIVLAVMEVEAWFLADTTHYERIHPDLSEEKIKANLEWNPFTAIVEDRDRPSEDLDTIYRIAGCRYSKRKANTIRTVDSLDCCVIYFEKRKEIEKLDYLLGLIDKFLLIAE